MSRWDPFSPDELEAISIALDKDRDELDAGGGSDETLTRLAAEVDAEYRRRGRAVRHEGENGARPALPLRWWYLEGPPAYCAVALVAAMTVERAIELVIEDLADPLEDDDPLMRGWRSSADELKPGVAQPANLPASPDAEGVYFLWFRSPREWTNVELEAIMRGRE